MSPLVSLYASAFLLGGMTLFSALVAPLVFMRLPAETAGRFIRALFPWYYLYILMFSGIASLALVLDPTRPLALLGMVVVFALGAYARQVLMPELNRLRDAADQGDTAAGHGFAAKHQRSVIINGVQWLLVLLMLGALVRPSPSAWQHRNVDSDDCASVRGWVDHKGRLTYWPSIAERYQTRRVWLLGEQHDQAAHHAWQLQVLTALHAQDPALVLAMEMFPRDSQAALDDWVAGASTWEQFLAASHWQEVWGFDPKLYQPLLEFAQRNQIPIVALNVHPSLARKVGDMGWEQLADTERQGITDPAPAGRHYREELRAVYEAHANHPAPVETTGSSNWVEGPVDPRKETPGPEHAETPGPAPAVAEPAEHADHDADFQRFLDVQLLWDRAMAEGIAQTLKGDKARRHVVAILGRGHIGPKRGVGLQLADLGVSDVVSLLPTSGAEFCSLDRPKAKPQAQAYFVMPEATMPGTGDPIQRPRLGVSLAMDPAGVRIDEVVKGSLAEQEGLAAGDIITHIAEQTVKGPEHVATVIKDQPAGTWLPIRIQRGKEERRQVIRFPPSEGIGSGH